ECKAELNQKDLIMFNEETSKKPTGSIFSKALEKLNQNQNLKSLLCMMAFVSLISFTGCAPQLKPESIEKITGDAELIKINDSLYAVIDDAGFLNSGFYVHPKGTLLIDSRFSQKH